MKDSSFYGVLALGCAAATTASWYKGTQSLSYNEVAYHMQQENRQLVIKDESSDAAVLVRRNQLESKGLGQGALLFCATGLLTLRWYMARKGEKTSLEQSLNSVDLNRHHVEIDEDVNHRVHGSVRHLGYHGIRRPYRHHRVHL